MELKITTLLLVFCIAINCSLSNHPRAAYKFSVESFYAVENAKQWDAFDARPEMYLVVASDSSSNKTRPSSKGSWSIEFDDSTDNNTFTIWDRGSGRIVIKLYDDDLGDADDNTSEIDNILGEIVFALVNDADDLILKKEVIITNDTGVIEFNNELGGFKIKYEKI